MYFLERNVKIQQQNPHRLNPQHDQFYTKCNSSRFREETDHHELIIIDKVFHFWAALRSKEKTRSKTGTDSLKSHHLGDLEASHGSSASHLIRSIEAPDRYWYCGTLLCHYTIPFFGDFLLRQK
jgi:hypothetical protein